MHTRASGAGQPISFRTTCGREIQVGHLALGGAPRPAQRFSLDISACPGTGDGTWAGLTAGGARHLAAALLLQAAECDAFPPQA